MSVTADVFETLRMPRLGAPVKLSNEALEILFDGAKLRVNSLRVRVEDISEEGVVTIAFAFCDANDYPLVNVGRHFMRAGDCLTLTTLERTLQFLIKE